MAKEISIIRQEAQQVQNATQVGENTAQRVGGVLTDIVDKIATIATYMGVATPTTNPGSPDGNVFYFATQAGTYTNFGSVVLTEGLNILLWNGTSWAATNVMNIVQETGDSETAVMSQRAVTEKLNTINDKINNQITEIEAAKDAALNEIEDTEQEAISNFNAQRVTPEMLSEGVKQLIETAGGGTINNLPDEEDITSTGGDMPVLKFKDKAYNQESFSGKGRVYLRKNIMDGKNILTQSMLNAANTEYIIQYDYDLNGASITVPEGCVLKFEGGSLNNGTIQSNKTILVNPTDKDCLSGIFYNNAGKRLNKDFRTKKDYIDCIDPILPYSQSDVIRCCNHATKSSIDKIQIIYYLQINNNVITTTDNFTYWNFATIKDMVELVESNHQTLYSLKFHKNVNFNDNASEAERRAYKNYVLNTVDEYRKYTDTIKVIYISNEENNRTAKGNDWNITHKELINELHDRGYKVGISCNQIPTTFAKIDNELVNMLDYIGINFYPSMSNLGFRTPISYIPKYIENTTIDLANRMKYIYKVKPDVNIQITESGCMPYEKALSNPAAWSNLGEKDTTGIIQFIFYTVSLNAAINCGIKTFTRWYQDGVDFDTEMNHAIFNKYLFE